MGFVCNLLNHQVPVTHFYFGLPFPHLKNTMADVEQQNVAAPAEEEAKKVETPEKAEAESTETVEKEEEEEKEEAAVAVVSPQKRPIEEVEKDDSPLKKPKIDEN